MPRKKTTEKIMPSEKHHRYNPLGGFTIIIIILVVL